MTKYRIGQRVRIKHWVSMRNLQHDPRGEVFTVVRLPGHLPAPYERYYTLNERVDETRVLGATEDALEPVYDGDTPSTWSEFERLTGFNPTRTPASAG